MTHSLFKACDRPNTICSLVSTDYSKAFDLFGHIVAICCLLELGLRPSLARWITDSLTSRSQAVRYHRVLSDTVPVTCGLPQGTLLGPLTFTAYVTEVVFRFFRMLHGELTTELARTHAGHRHCRYTRMGVVGLGQSFFVTLFRAQQAISFKRSKSVDDLNLLEIRNPPTSPSYLQQDLTDVTSGQRKVT
ncbi:hypothetical protein Bbelb_401220 [Branchiostoma belcheri]|nr:hypothetical protein Bbelb_401220 [Branchiostoma belcheri]